MKSKLKYIYTKYNDIKYSLLKNLNSRKTKIKEIWNKKIPQISKRLNQKTKSKLNNKKILVQNFEFNKLSFQIL